MPTLWPAENLHLRLFGASNVTLTAGRWDTPNVLSSFWRFYYNHDAGGRLDRPDGCMELRARTPYFVPSRVLFTCRNTADIRHFYIHFDVLGLPEPLRREWFSAPVELAPSATLDGLLASPPPLAPHGEPDLWSGCFLKAVLFQALGEALGQIPRSARARYEHFAAAGEMLQPALRCIEEYLGEPLPNERLAALCYLSPDHFIRRFREVLGQTPAAYVQERRVLAAAQMLVLTNRNLDDIAAATGFGNRFYFSRVFTRHFHISPAAYRKAGYRYDRESTRREGRG